MGFFKNLFKTSKDKADSSVSEERVDCNEVVNAIQQRMRNFKNGKGMILVVQEACKVNVYYFNGHPKCSWNYTNHQLFTDRAGETFLEDKPEQYVLKINKEPNLASLIKQNFSSYEVSVNPLWKLNPQAWDYDAMKVMHEHDFGIRISIQ